MGRRPMRPGTWGHIHVKLLGPKKHEASAWYKDRGGKLRRIRRTAQSKTAAEDDLKEALSKIGDEVRSGDITPDTRVSRVAELWMQSLREDVAAGTVAPNTVRIYAGYVKNWINPSLGSLCINAEQLTPAACEGLVKRVRRKRSLDAAKSCRSVLSAICGFAMKHRAITVNPVRSIDRLRASEEDKKPVRAMSKKERTELREKLPVFAQSRQTDSKGRSLGRRGQVWLDLPDLLEAMLATGVRIGEILAVDADSIDTQKCAVTFNHHVVRVPEGGLVRAKGRKNGEPSLTLLVPKWSLPMWRRRKLASGGGSIFTAWNGGLLDPSTLMHRIREALDECGFDWVTGHVWRKTVALVLKEAGLSTEQIADQLGNTTRVAEKHYVPKTGENPQAAAALEGMW